MDPEKRVGWRVQVFWEGEAEWFDGAIAAFSADEGFFVKYDDGEEQWEVRSTHNGTQAMRVHDNDLLTEASRFLSKPEADDSLLSIAVDADEQQEEQQQQIGGGKWSQHPPPSSAYTDDEYDSEEDNAEDEGDEEEERAVVSKTSPMPEEDSSPITKFPQSNSKPSPSASPQNQRQQQPRKVTSYVNNAMFSRDEETLCEMRKALQTGKKTLVHEHQTLAKQLVEKEQLSVNLKRELNELKTQVTLASVLGYAPSTVGGQSSVLKTSSDWSERVLDQKLQNKQTRQEIAELKACVQGKQHAIQQRQRQCDQLKDKLARVPRHDLCTIVDLQVKIAKLLEEKRALEAQKPKTSLSSAARRMPGSGLAKSNADDGTFGWTHDADARKVTLEKELGKLELASSRAKDEIHKWRLNYERENARILPLKARLISLQQELTKFESSNVLLRSAFLRLNPDAEGRIPVQTAAEALLALAPADVSSFANTEAILTALRQRDLLSSDAQQCLVFSGFVACFNCLFKS